MDLLFYLMFLGGEMLIGESLAKGIDLFRNKSSQLASGGFGSKKELLELIGEDGFRISKDIQFSQKVSQEGLGVIGATGTGKTTSLFYPNLLEDSLRGSIVVTDPKKELWNDTRRYQESIGRKTLLFSPLDPEASAKYNPLSLCKSNSDIIQLAQLILLNGSKSIEVQTGIKAGGIEWINMAVPLFSAGLLYVYEKGKPVNTISNAVKILINNNLTDLKALFRTASEAAREQFNIFLQSAASGNTAASIKSTLATNVQLFLDENIIRVSSDTDFSADDLRSKKIALYVSYREVKSAYLSPFTSIFFSQLINQLYDNMKYKNPVYFKFDEFANVGVINNLSSILSTSRSRSLSFLICLQSIAQLFQLYGVYNTKNILNNLKTKCILSSISDMETLNYISEISGITEIKNKGESISGNRRTISISNQTKKLLNADEIRRLEKEEILIIAHNKKPIRTLQNIYYKENKYIRRVAL